MYDSSSIMSKHDLVHFYSHKMLTFQNQLEYNEKCVAVKLDLRKKQRGFPVESSRKCGRAEGEVLILLINCVALFPTLLEKSHSSSLLTLCTKKIVIRPLNALNSK